MRPIKTMSLPHLRVFIGRDPRKPLDYNILANSIVESASVPVSITALSLKTLPIKRKGLTEFTFSRFLVPYLCGYKGTALFLDADMVCCADIKELFDSADGSAVQVNKLQAEFEWASAMLFNCEKCQILTPEYIEDAKNKLFDFAWTEFVGEFPSVWNWCVPYAGETDRAKLYHFTQGTPNWRETRGTPHDFIWNEAYKATIRSCSFQELMGNSVHVAKMKAVC